MFLIALGVIDVVAGIILALYGVPAYKGSGFIATFGGFMLLKGLWSVLVAYRKDYYKDIWGAVDIVAGVLMILLFFGIQHFLFAVAGAVVIIKGVWSFVSDIG